jgi:hypothetical protein
VIGQIIGFAGGVLAYSSATGGRVTPVTLGTGTAPIIGINPGRQSIVFHNPGTVTVYVAPMLNASGNPFLPTLLNPSGCFQIVAGGTLVLSGEIQCAWQGFCASGANPFTIMESNI